MTAVFLRTAGALLLLSSISGAGEMGEIVKGRIGSRDEAASVAEDLCRAFPERTREIVNAIGTEYPYGAMAAAIAAAKALPMKAGEAAEGVKPVLPPELRTAAWDIVVLEAGR